MITALSSDPLDQGNAQFQPSNLEFTSVDVGNKATNVIPRASAGEVQYPLQRPSHAGVIARPDRCTRRNCRRQSHSRACDLGAEQFGQLRHKPGAFTDTVVAAIKDVTGRTPDLNTGGGTSDARFIKNYCPVIEFGLVGQTMHQIDEHTKVADLEKLTQIYRGVLDRYFA